MCVYKSPPLKLWRGREYSGRAHPCQADVLVVEPVGNFPCDQFIYTCPFAAVVAQ